MENYEKIKSVFAEAEIEAVKFEKGNASAGTRLRAKMQEIAVLAKSVRADVQAIKNKG